MKKQQNKRLRISLAAMLVFALCVALLAVLPMTVSAAEGELSISVQPQQSIRYASENADFYVEAAGGTAPYTYKWQWISNAEYHDNGNWSDISDSDNATLTVAVTGDISGNFYRCIITDSASATVTSDAAMLFVPDLPNIKTNLSFAKGHNTELDLAYFSGNTSNFNDYRTLKLISDGQSFVEPYIRWTSQTTKHYFLSVYPTGKFTAMNETGTWNNESEHGLLVAVSNSAGTLIIDKSIDLTFQQMLTKVNLDLSFDGFATEPTVSGVRIYCGNDYTINYLIYSITADAYTYDANEYSSFTQEGKSSWSSIVVPQTGVCRIEVEIDGTVYTYESAEDITLKSGKAVNLDLTVTSGNTTVAATSTTESDWVTATLGHTFDANGKCDCGKMEISKATFPDANFRSYIAENIDTDKDGVLSPEEIAAVTELYIQQMNITTLAGAQYFTNLDTLAASENNLTDTTLDFSMLTKLQYLNLSSVYNLESLNVSGCKELKELYLDACMSLTALDVSKNTELSLLNVANTGLLTSLNLSANEKLEQLNIQGSSLNSLKLYSNADVTILGNANSHLQHCGVGYVNLADIAPDLTQVIKVEDGTLGEDGWVKLDEGKTYFIYYTATGNADAPLPIFVTIHPVTNPDDDLPAHTFTASVANKDATHHYTEVCATCRTGNEAAVAEHTFADGICTVCGYACVHTTHNDAGVCSICQKQRGFSVTVGASISYFDDMIEALALAQKGTEAAPATIKLYTDITVAEAVTMTGGYATLDLNGKTVSFTTQGGTCLTLDGVSLTICDTSAANTGTLVFDMTVNIFSHGGLTLDNASTLTLESGTLTANPGYPLMLLGGSTVIQNGGTVNNGVFINSGKYILNNGSVAISFINKSNYEDDDWNIELEIYGGTLTVNDTHLVFANGNFIPSINATIAGGIFSGMSQLYVIPSGEITLSGGTFEGGLKLVEGYEVTLADVLAPGYAYYDANGNLISLTEGQTELTGKVTVGVCTHNFGDYLSDAEGHWHECKACGATDTKLAHTPEDDDGSCLTAVHCTACGYVITEAKNDHSFDNACDTDCNNDGCTHTRATEHTPEYDDDDCTTDILCSVCDAVTTKGNEAHTGGTATCTAKAECTVCGTKYGSTLAHTPEADDGNCLTEVKCSVCQTVTTPANAAHTGGTATCQAQANCSECGKEYGELGSHIFIVEQSDKTHHWNKCLYCDETDTKAEHTDTDFDSACDGCGTDMKHIEFSKVSLTLGGDIGINYFFTLGDVVLSNEAYFIVTYPDGNTERIAVSSDLIGTPKGDTSGNTYYKVSAYVAAKEMADNVKVELFVNEIPVKAFNYSIQQYANVIFADASSDVGLVELVKKMLNYGAAAQVAFGYNTDKLANSVLDESDRTVSAVEASALTGATTNGTVSGFEYQMFSCILETKTTLRQYFTLPEGSVSEYTFTIDGESVTPTKTTAEGKTMYYIDVANIAARDMDVVHTLVITKGEETRTITCSVHSYMKAVLTKNGEDAELVNAINAMYEYGEAAKQYLAD